MPRFRYTAEQLDFIRANYAVMPIDEVTVAFNARFGLEKTIKAVSSSLKNHKITCGRKGSARIKRPRIYTKEQAQFLRDNCVGRSRAALAALFNAEFDRDITLRQVKSFVGNRGLTSGLTGYYEKGQEPWNRGVKGYMGANVTSFKKGQIPPNKKRLWSERINRDGFIEISVPERNPHTGFPTRYRHKHVWLWEVANGPVPKGSVVCFVDGNKQNCEVVNLMLLTRGELLALNTHSYKDAPAELKPSLLALAKVEAKAGIRTRPGRGRQKK